MPTDNNNFLIQSAAGGNFYVTAGVAPPVPGLIWRCGSGCTHSLRPSPDSPGEWIPVEQTAPVGSAKFGLPPGMPESHGHTNLPPCSECGRTWMAHNGWECLPGTAPGPDGPEDEPDYDDEDDAEHDDGPDPFEPPPPEPADEIHTGNGQLPGPSWLTSKTSKGSDGTSFRTCSTCGRTRIDAADEFVKSTDGLFLCQRCYLNFSICTYCGWRVSPEEFEAKVYTHLKCPDCAPSKRTKLNVKQMQEFVPKTDVLRQRRDKVWSKRGR